MTSQTFCNAKLFNFAKIAKRDAKATTSHGLQTKGKTVSRHSNWKTATTLLPRQHCKPKMCSVHG